MNLLPASLGAAVLACAASSLASTLVITRVARTGDSTPESGVSFTEIVTHDARITSAGGVIFEAKGSNNGYGIYSLTPQGLKSIVIPGMQLTGYQGTIIIAGAGDSYASNDIGQALVEAGIPIGARRSLLYGADHDNLIVVGETGALTSGDPGRRYQDFTSLQLNNSGQIAFASQLDIPRDELWAGPVNAPFLVMSRGDVAPETGGLKYLFLGGLSSLSDSGQIGYGSILEGKLSGQRNEAVYAGLPQSPRLLAMTGQGAPRGGQFASFSPPMLNAQGNALFNAALLGPGATKGLYLSSDGSLQALVRSGDPAPGTNLLIARTSAEYGINDHGHIGYLAELSDKTTGLWVGEIENPKLIARTQMPTELADGEIVTFGYLIANFRLDINSRGRAPILAVVGNTTRALLMRNAQGQLVRIAQEDQAFDGRIIEHIRYTSNINELNQTAFNVSFTDGTSGVYLAQVPEAELTFGNDPSDLQFVWDGNISELRSHLLTARGNVPPGGVANGRWNGRGLIISPAAEAAAIDGTENLSIGYALNSALPKKFNQFAGQPVSPDDLLVALTKPGDANLDGIVNNNDITILAGFYRPGTTGRHWYQADFNYDGEVNNNDITILAAFYSPNTPANPAGPAVAAVPEPSIILSLIAPLFLIRRR